MVGCRCAFVFLFALWYFSSFAVVFWEGYEGRALVRICEGIFMFSCQLVDFWFMVNSIYQVVVYEKDHR